MALDTNIRGATSGIGAEVDSSNNLKVVLPADGGGIRMFSENDPGAKTGTADLVSPETDNDYRLRVSQDYLLDEVNFNYTAQDTGKHNYAATTMVNAWTAGQLTTNNTNLVTTTIGTNLVTYAFFPTLGTTTLSADFEVGFSAQPVVNAFIEFGLALPGATTGAPADGVFFRLSSAGLQGIASNNGTETNTGIFPSIAGGGTWTYTNNKKYQFIIYHSAVATEFWVNEDGVTSKLGSLNLPSGQGRMTMASSVPICIKHRNTGGAAGGALQGQFGSYNVRLGGTGHVTVPSLAGQRMFGSYQGMQGGTQGSLAAYANSANPTAAVPTNTTAALGSGLGGQFWETATLAVNTDGIISSYQVPAGTVNVPGRRLVIRGVGLSSYVQTVIAGGPLIAQWSLAFGHTAVSLATAEAATTKAPRRIPLSGFTQVVTANQAVSTLVSQQQGFIDFGDAPIFVNPGEFVQLVKKHVGTVATAGVIAHVVTFVYGWE